VPSRPCQTAYGTPIHASKHTVPPERQLGDVANTF